MLRLLFSALIFFCIANIVHAQDERFAMPELKYGFAALEPHVDSQTMKIHYSKHHQGYLDNLNKTGAKTIAGAGAQSIEDLLLTVDVKNTAVRNNGGGHYNHTLFWEILSPSPKTQAEGKLALAINKQFVSQDSLIKLMKAEGLKRFGSGWVWLMVTPLKTLAVTTTSNQDNPIMNLEDTKRGIPILGIDVWEHAYYLKHQNKRAEYLNTIWNVVDWAQVEKNYEAALKSPLLAKIDKSSWKAYNEFNQLYNQIMFPAKIGDYALVKSKSGELLAKTEMLSKSNVPGSFQNADIKKSLTGLLTAIKSLDKSASKKPKDNVIKENLMKVEEAYSQLQSVMGK